MKTLWTLLFGWPRKSSRCADLLPLDDDWLRAAAEAAAFAIRTAPIAHTKG